MEDVDQANANGLTARAALADVAGSTKELLDSTGLGADAPFVKLAWKEGSVKIRFGHRLPAGFAWIDLGGEHGSVEGASFLS